MATETKEMKLWKEKLSIKIRQGYLTEADKKIILQSAKVILSSPIEEVSKHWNRLLGYSEDEDTCFYPGDKETRFEMVMAVHTYPGVKPHVGNALVWEMETGKLKPYISPKCPCRPDGESV